MNKRKTMIVVLVLSLIIGIANIGTNGFALQGLEAEAQAIIRDEQTGGVKYASLSDSNKTPTIQDIIASGYDPYEQWGLNKIQATQARNVLQCNYTVRVGIVDSGIGGYNEQFDKFHPALGISSGMNFKEALDTQSLEIDEAGHGTHVAGIVGANGFFDIDGNFCFVKGVNSGADLITLQVAHKFQDYCADPNACLRAIEHATAQWNTSNRIHVLNFSIGTKEESEDLREAINDFPGLFVCSAGNAGKNIDNIPQYPAYYSSKRLENPLDNVLVVGAIDINDERASFSNYGAQTVDIYAPGVNILSTIPFNLEPEILDDYTDVAPGYAITSGTSMATPFVTGVASLLMSYDSSLTPAELKEAILEGADTISITLPDGSKQNVKRLNALKAVYNVMLPHDYLTARIENGNAIITGTKSNFSEVMEDLDGELEIPAWIGDYSVTGIDKDAFKGYTNIVDVEIPYTVTQIGESAFEGCDKLQEVYFEEQSQLAYIDYDAFKDCSALTRIDLPTSVRIIDSHAFKNAGLTSIDIGYNVVFIGNKAFEGCPIEKINYDATVLRDYNELETPFYGLDSQRTEIYIGTTATKIPNYLFSSVPNIIKLRFYEQSNIQSIGDYAFNGCSGVTDLVLPNSLQSIGAYAFGGIGITSITIPASVTYIGEAAFAGAAFTDITVADGNTSFMQGVNALVEESDKLLIAGTSAGQIPNGVIRIGDMAFADNNALTQITIPSSVTRIDVDAFAGCKNLTSVTFDGNSQLNDIENGAFFGCEKLEEIAIPKSVANIGFGAFWGCKDMEAVTFEDESDLEYIGIYAFCDCTSLSSVTIPKKIFSIGESAFENCANLEAVIFEEDSELRYIGARAFCGTAITEIAIPESVENIYNGAFWDCEDLTTIRILRSINTGEVTAYYSNYDGDIHEVYPSIKRVIVPDEETYLNYLDNNFIWCDLKEYITCDPGLLEYRLLSNGTYAVIGCAPIPWLVAGVIIPATFNTKPVTEIASNAFAKNGILGYVTMLGEIKTIGSYAFDGCQRLLSVVMPGTVTEIGSFAFRECSILSSIEIPSSVTSIGMGAFQGCSNLQFIEIPNGVTAIEDYTFSGCVDLTSVRDLSNPRQIENSGVIDPEEYFAFELPGTITRIGANAFGGCQNLRKANIPSSVTEIGNYAFAGCTLLGIVYFPANVITLGNYVFNNCLSLGKIVVPNIKETYDGYVVQFSDAVLKNKVQCEKNGLDFVPYGGYGFEVKRGNEALVGEIVIPSTYNGLPVVGVANNGFKNCTQITSVILPSTVEGIGAYAFSGCTNLTWVEMPEGLIGICEYAFANSGIEDVVLPSSLWVIENYAFANCDNLGVVAILRPVDAGLIMMTAEAFSGSNNVCFVVFNEDSYYGYYDYFVSLGAPNYAEWLQFIMYI